jgi:exopolysaccharide production protein ExoQ
VINARESYSTASARPRGLSPALILYTVVFSGSIYLLFGTFDEGSLSQKAGDSPLYLGLLLLTYSTMIVELASSRAKAIRTLAGSPAVLLFACSGVVSMITAGVPSVSAVRFGIYLVTITAGLVISVRYSLDEFCETFFYVSFAIMITHFLAYPLLAGRIVYDPLERQTLLGLTSYAGLFPHKSVAATFFSLSLVISVARYFGSRSAPATRRSSLILACGSAIAILLAGAVGRLLSLLAGTLVVLLIRAFLRKDHIDLFILLGALVLGALAYFAISDGTWIYFFGRSWDLTGRQELFELWPRFFWERPVFGYGYDGFFTDVAGAPAAYLFDLNGGRGFSTFESVYLDLLIQFGLIGGLLFIWILLAAFWNAIKYYRRGTSKYKLLPVFFVAWAIIGSGLDSGILQQNSIDCVLLFWIYFGVDRVYNAQPRRFMPRNQGSSRFSVVRTRVEYR